MTDFDPYGDWLGIVARSKPTYYDLLQLDPQESQPQTVQRAAKSQLRKLDQVRPDTAAQREALKKLRQRIARAARCLADESLRSEYDQRIEQSSSPQQRPDSTTNAPNVAWAEEDRFSGVFPTQEIRSPRTKLSKQLKQQRNRDRAVRNSIILAALSLVGLVYLVCTQTPQGRTFVQSLMGSQAKIAINTAGKSRNPTSGDAPALNQRSGENMTDSSTGSFATPRRAATDAPALTAEDVVRRSVDGIEQNTEPLVPSNRSGEPGAKRGGNEDPDADGNKDPDADGNKDPADFNPPETSTMEMSEGDDLGDGPATVTDEMELKKLASLLTAARQALSRQETQRAAKLLKEAESVARRPADADQVKRLQTLATYVQAYWDAANDGLRQLQSGTELRIGGEPVFVVERTSETLVLRQAGRNQTYQCNSLPVPLRVFLAERWFDSTAVSTNVFRGAMMSVTAGYKFEEASRQWQVAEAAGKLSPQDRVDLERAATDDYGPKHSNQ